MDKLFGHRNMLKSNKILSIVIWKLIIIIIITIKFHFGLYLNFIKDRENFEKLLQPGVVII